MSTGLNQTGAGTRTGQMTAVMRAVGQGAGPKVLRIGLLTHGKIVEERVIKQRTTVTVGPSENSTFVVQAGLPPNHPLFELVAGEYYLNVLDGMTGKVALKTGISDLAALKGQAKRVGNAYQIKITEDARGRIVVGDATFLFQFVAPPPVQPKPQLPLVVMGGMAGMINWDFTIITAFSFMLHFGMVGLLYSDWFDPVYGDDIQAVMSIVGTTPPPVTEVVQPVATATATATGPTTADTGKPTTPKPMRGGPAAPGKAGAAGGTGATTIDPRTAGLVNEANAMAAAILAGLGGAGPGVAGATRNDGSPAIDHNSMGSGSAGGTSRSGGTSGLPGSGGTGPVGPVGSGRGLAGIGEGGAGSPSGTGAGPTARVVIKGDVGVGGVSASAPVANADAVIRSRIAGAARACYNRALEKDPTLAGRVTLTIKVGPSGEVESAGASGMPAVAGCISGAAYGARFDKPGPSGATISTSFTFVPQK